MRINQQKQQHLLYHVCKNRWRSPTGKIGCPKHYSCRAYNNKKKGTFEFPFLVRREGFFLRKRLRDNEPSGSHPLLSKRNKSNPKAALVLRRERDSNPRYLSVRRFSRPMQSTTLPSLQHCSTTSVE